MDSIHFGVSTLPVGFWWEFCIKLFIAVVLWFVAKELFAVRDELRKNNAELERKTYEYGLLMRLLNIKIETSTGPFLPSGEDTFENQILTRFTKEERRFLEDTGHIPSN